MVVTVRATGKILVDGANRNNLPSGIFAQYALGRSGVIQLTANFLLLRGGSLISATSGIRLVRNMIEVQKNGRK